MLMANICGMCFVQPFRYSTIKSHLKLNIVLNKENYIPPSLSLSHTHTHIHITLDDSKTYVYGPKLGITE